MSDIEKKNVRYGVKFVSFLLIAGGILGIVAAAQMAGHFFHEHRLDRAAVAVISIVLIAWSILKGFDLWRGRPSGYRWAKVLFLLQIPVITVSRFTYEFSTGMSARISFGHSHSRFGANIGSSLNLLASPEPLGWLLGINLFALLVFIYLVVVTRRGNRAIA